MANTNFLVHNGLTVGPAFVYAGNGDIITSGNISVTGSASFGGLSSNQIYSGSNNVTVSGSTVNVAIASSNIASFSSTGLTLTGAVNGNTFNGVAVYGGTIGNSGATLTGTLSTAAQTNITSVGTLSSLAASGVITSGGNINVTSATNSTSTTSGSIVTAGGIGVAQDAYIGGKLYVGGNTTFINTTIINTTDTLSAPTILAGQIGNSGASLVGTTATVNTVSAGLIGNASTTLLQGTLVTSSAAQGNITSLGTLTGLTVSGTTNLQGTTNGATINATNMYATTIGNTGAAINGNLANFSAIYAGTIGNTSANLRGTLLTAAQTNITSVGTLTGLTVSGTIVPSSNASIDIGATGTQYFNNIYAVNFLGTSTTAKYADLAERYSADADYEPGTVVDFGGTAEVTISNINGSQYVAGVVSTNPAYMMNSDADGLYIALVGRVPCKVTGRVRKGQMMVSNGDGTARGENNPIMGSVIGKALENFSGGTGVIEVVVGRL